MQTATCDDTSKKPMAEFHPFGIKSGPAENPSYDPTCFWFPNIACCEALLQHVGFQEVEQNLEERACWWSVSSASSCATKRRSP